MSMETHSGGCQCGAVRFRLTGMPGTSSVCYCRMCQKASAAHALALVSVGEAALEWTRGQPSWFQSSNAARRGFCDKCGTPLAYDAPDGLALFYLFDTTLRDGQQTPGIDFSLDDKMSIAACSTSLASTMSRAAIPAPIRPTPRFLPSRAPMKASFTAFGMTRRAGRFGVQRSRPAGADAGGGRCGVLVAKSWDYHVRVALKTAPMRRTLPASPTA
jgi:hypothetical protein